MSRCCSYKDKFNTIRQENPKFYTEFYFFVIYIKIHWKFLVIITIGNFWKWYCKNFHFMVKYTRKQ